MTPDAIRKPGGSARPRPWFRRYPVAAFLVALILAFVTSPFEEASHNGDLIESLGLSVLMLTGLLALSVRRRALVLGIVLVTPALAGKWLNHWWPVLIPDALFLVPALLFILFMLLIFLRYLLRATRIDSEVLCAGVAGYLMMGMLWGLAYILTARLVSDSFVVSGGPDASHSMKGFTAMYFSFITLTTVGYGDILPVSGAARMLAMTEAMTGTFYMAIMVARLVSLYYAPSPPVEGGDRGKS